MSKLIRNTSIYTIGNVLPKAAGFVLLPIYTKFLTPGEYGIVNSMQSLQIFLAIVLTLALNRSILRLYWDYKTEKEQKDFLGSIALSMTVISIVATLTFFILHSYIGMIYKSINFHPYYTYIILIEFATVFSYIPSLYLMLKEKAKYFVLLNLSQFIVNTALILWFVIVKDEAAAGFLKALLLGRIVMLPIYIIITLRVINIVILPAMVKAAMLFSLPIVPTIINAWVINQSNRIFIERYFTIEDVGIFGLAVKITAVISIFAAAFNQAYAPLFFRLANAEDQILSKIKLRKYNNVFILVIIMLCGCVAFFAKEVIVLLFNKEYHQAYLLFPWLALSVLFSQFGGIVGKYFQQSKKMKENMLIVLVFGGLNIGLNFLIIPIWGAYGAAIVTAITMFLIFIVSYLYTKKHCYFVEFAWPQIAIFITGFIILIVSFQYIIIENILLSLIMKIIISLLMGYIVYKKYSNLFINLFFRKDESNII
jgi:O-antigen/teichoic acid export membrane protein